MKKINWFARLFMSWKSLVAHVAESAKDNEETIIMKNDNEHYKKEIEELKKRLADGENLRNDFMSKIGELQNKITQYMSDKEQLSEKVQEKEIEITKKVGEIDQLRNKIIEHQNNQQTLKQEISERLMPLDKINRTFFGVSGNKGKGELGELQLRQIFQQSGIDKNLWIENLMVGKSQVEFAIKSGVGPDAKYIPVDSKVIEQGIEYVDNQIVISDKFSKSVKEQAKKISKYLNKKNTSAYGILVLQNDEVYMQLFKEFPSIFSEAINEYKVYVLSPSSFVQYAWSIDNIINIYERINQEEEIYDQMMSTLDTISKFTHSLEKTHSNFNIAMNRHYNTLVNKQTKLIKKLDKAGKIKDSKILENL